MDLFGSTSSDYQGDDFTANDEEESLAGDTPQRLDKPQSTSFLLGHTDIEQNLLALWQTGRLPHAMVFTGVKGIGKATFAYRLARFILKQGNGHPARAESFFVGEDDAVFRKVASGGHGDLLTIARPWDERKGKAKTVLPVEEIRKVTPFLRQTASEGGWQVVIIDDADTMNTASQNALLKILEEPPARALIILVAHGTGGLLPTIRSRCRFVPFSPLNDEDLQSLLKKTSASPLPAQDLAVLTALARGSAGQGTELVQQGGMETIHGVLDCLSSIHAADPAQIDRFALSIGKSGSDDVINHFLYILRWWFETLMTAIAQGQSAAPLGRLELAVPQGYTLPSFLRLQEAVEEHIKICDDGNLDKRYMVFKALRIIQNGGR